MNKVNLVILLFLFITQKVDSQSIDQPMGKLKFKQHLRVEIGVNIIPVLGAIENKGLDSVSNSPYLLNARLSYKNWGIRGSMGGWYNKDKTFVFGFKDSDKRLKQSLTYRVGIDYRKTYNHKFSSTVGVDWVRSFSEKSRVLDSGFDVIEEIDLKNTVGGGISGSFQWWPGNHIGIGIETSIYYMTGTTVAGRKFVNFPELNDDLVRSKITEIQLPVGVFVHWRF